MLLFFPMPPAEFINLISSESNEVCGREDKRTINPEHVMKALQVFPDPCYLLSVFIFVRSACWDGFATTLFSFLNPNSDGQC